MRQRKADLQALVNGNLAFAFGAVHLTSHAGLELFARYLRHIRFNALIRAAFVGPPVGGDFGITAMVRLLVGLLVVGGRRLEHVGYVQTDPLFRRFCQLQVLPTARTVSRWLTQFTMATVERLQRLNAAVIAHVIPGLRLRTITGAAAGSRALSPARLGSLFRATDRVFDLVVADCPPLLEREMPPFLQDVLDGFVFVVRARHAPREAIRRAGALLRRGRITGLVLNARRDALRRGGVRRRTSRRCPRGSPRAASGPPPRTPSAAP